MLIGGARPHRKPFPRRIEKYRVYSRFTYNTIDCTGCTTPRPTHAINSTDCSRAVFSHTPRWASTSYLDGGWGALSQSNRKRLRRGKGVARTGKITRGVEQKQRAAWEFICFDRCVSHGNLGSNRWYLSYRRSSLPTLSTERVSQRATAMGECAPQNTKMWQSRQPKLKPEKQRNERLGNKRSNIPRKRLLPPWS